MSDYAVWRKCDDETYLLIIPMTREERDEFFPHFAKVGNLEENILGEDNNDEEKSERGNPEDGSSDRDAR